MAWCQVLTLLIVLPLLRVEMDLRLPSSSAYALDEVLVAYQRGEAEASLWVDYEKAGAMRSKVGESLRSRRCSSRCTTTTGSQATEIPERKAFESVRPAWELSQLAHVLALLLGPCFLGPEPHVNDLEDAEFGIGGLGKDFEQLKLTAANLSLSSQEAR